MMWSGSAVQTKGLGLSLVNRAGLVGGSYSCADGAMTKRTAPYPPEVRARAVRMVVDHQGGHGSQDAAIRSMAPKIGCSGETLRHWARC